MRASLLSILLVAGFVLTVPDNASAYLDPGTGSYLFQLAAAGLFAGLMTFKLYWQRIKDWFAARKAPEAPPPAARAVPMDDSTPK